MPELKPPRCVICKDAGWLKGPGPMGSAVRCVCNQAPEPIEPPVPPVRQPRRGWAERYDL